MVDVKVALSHTFVPQSIFIVLILLTIWQTYTGVVSFFPLDKAEDVRQVQGKASKIEAGQDSLTAGLNTTFFGDYVPNNLNDADVKQSMLNLKVVGIMFSETKEASHVIIRTAGGREQAFSVGDLLPGGSIIKRITPDGVLIGRKGVLERLNLPKNVLIFEPPSKPLVISK